MALPLDDTDISAMDPESAREYVLDFIKSLKETQGQKKRKLEELELWQGRIARAESGGRPDLRQAALERVEAIRDELAVLETEEEELTAKVSALKENLKKLKGRFDFSIDAERLLADLNMIVGERETDQKFTDLKAQSDLEALKRKIEKEDGAGG